jgi:hypothetical protein
MKFLKMTAARSLSEGGFSSLANSFAREARKRFYEELRAISYWVLIPQSLNVLLRCLPEISLYQQINKNLGLIRRV